MQASKESLRQQAEKEEKDNVNSGRIAEVHPKVNKVRIRRKKRDGCTGGGGGITAVAGVRG